MCDVLHTSNYFSSFISHQYSANHELLYHFDNKNNFSSFADFHSISLVTKSIQWPTDVDFKGVIHGLLRAQYTYHLDIGKWFSLVCKEMPKLSSFWIQRYTYSFSVKLANGVIRERITSAKLFVDDLFYLAKERIDGNNPLQISGGIDYAVAIEYRNYNCSHNVCIVILTF